MFSEIRPLTRKFERLAFFIFSMFVLLVVLLSANDVFAVTRYVDPASPNEGSGYTTWETAAHSISSGLSAMSGGDTLIIRDGIYTGAENMIVYNSIPSGSPGNYTVIRAENDFGVIIDAQQIANRRPGNINASYLEVHGIEFKNPGDHGWDQGAAPLQVQGDHIKMFRVGAVEAYQQPIDASKGDMSPIFSVTHSSYVLLEECYAFGWGRYVFSIYDSEYVVVRRSIGRLDGWAWGVARIFSNYSSRYIEYQNNIALDMNEPRHWHPGSSDQLWSGFSINKTASSFEPTSIFLSGNIFMNISGTDGATLKDANGNSHGADYNQVLFQASDSSSAWDNNLMINTVGGIFTYGPLLISNSTFMYINKDNGMSMSGTGISYIKNDKPIIKNSLFVDVDMAAVTSVSAQSNFNAFYNNGTNYSGVSAGVNDLSSENDTEVNPYWSDTNTSGGLKYPVRIEDGSNLDGRGEGGIKIGAKIVKRYGVSGTLYGEAGYNKLTEVNLWPFPNEHIIKQRMAAYTRWDPYDNIDPNNAANPDTYVKGNRGFAASGTGLYGGSITLTSYVWEYLGNPCPKEICNYTIPSSPNSVRFTGK